jgi:hypothetical protein
MNSSTMNNKALVLDDTEQFEESLAIYGYVLNVKG